MAIHSSLLNLTELTAVEEPSRRPDRDRDALALLVGTANLKQEKAATPIGVDGSIKFPNPN